MKQYFTVVIRNTEEETENQQGVLHVFKTKLFKKSKVHMQYFSDFHLSIIDCYLHFISAFSQRVSMMRLTQTFNTFPPDNLSLIFCTT